MLCGSELQFVESVKYLGVQFVAAKKLACSVEHVRVNVIGHLMPFCPGAKEHNLSWLHYNCLNPTVYHSCCMRLK